MNSRQGGNIPAGEATAGWPLRTGAYRILIEGRQLVTQPDGAGRRRSL